MNVLRSPTVVGQFRTLVKGGYLFADKTMLIDEILNRGDLNILFTRPRRFGKTLALSMLDRFFNIEYKDEESIDDSFEGLKISRLPQYKQLMENGVKNGYAVIMMDMSRIIVTNSPSFQTSMKNYLKLMIEQQFSYLQNSDSLTDIQKTRLFSDDDSSTADIRFQDLCFALKAHHRKDLIVLVDEYDAPVNSFVDNDQPTFVTEYGEFLRSAFKGNNLISMRIFAGVQKIVVEGMFSSLNDMRHIGVTNSAFDEYFGITADEMRGLIERCIRYRYPDTDDGEIRSLTDERYRTASEWFDGYNIGDTDIFNPWSAMNFLEENVLHDDPVRPYWKNTAESKVLISLASHANQSVLEEVKESYISGKEMVIDNIDTVAALWKRDGELDENDLYSLLLSTGYLTSRYQDGQYHLRVPNREIRMCFDELMGRIFCINLPRATKLLNDIVKRDEEAVRKNLEKLMMGGSYLDGWDEYRYKTWLHDLFALHGYTSITERECGEGRVDLLIEGYGNNPSIIFELKVEKPDTDTDLGIIAEEGLKQIHDNRYTDAPGLKNPIALSVAFRKKSCSVRFPTPSEQPRV